MEPENLSISYAGHYRFVDNSTRIMHWHHGAELVLFTVGVCRTRFASGEDFECSPMHVLVTPPGLAHLQYDNSSDCEAWYLVLEESLHPEDFSLRMITLGEDAISAEWFRQIFELCEKHEPDTASRLFELLWHRLLEIESRSETRRTLHPALWEAVQWMNRHYCDDLSVRGVAKHCSVSVSLLNMLFNRQFHVGPRRYLLSLRMREARRLLLDNRYRIGEVAAQVGFQSANYFARAFKAYHRVTPEDYRNGSPEFVDWIRLLE